jgi:hypothetical protein
MKIVLKEFPTHIAKTDNKYAANKMLKINNQAIYSGALNRFQRAIVVKNMHEYFIKCIPRGFKIDNYPVKINYLFRTVRNHGSISMRKGKTCWKPVEDDYKANWDIQNLAMIWMKTGDDALQEAGVIVDDNADYVHGGQYEVEFVEKLEDREIIITFT